MMNVVQGINDDLSSVAARIRQSLVHIQSGKFGSGAGTIWHADGLILTNAHVAQAGDLVVTLSDGESLPAKVLAYDEGRDLAALYVEARELPTIELGDSRGVKAGQFVMAMGNPYGVTGAVTAGVVIGTDYGFPDRPTDGREWLMLSIILRPGYSGGPLVDVNGRLLGINTAVGGIKVGMAVPIHTAKTFLKEELHQQLMV